MAVMKGCEPFAFDGDEVGVLLLHGYSGSPQGMRLWGEYLSKEGFTVSGPRLPGHGTTPQDLAGTTWSDWTGEAEMALRGLRERCSSIFIGALSMGGALALDLASKHPDVIGGLALVNTFIQAHQAAAKLAPMLGKIPIYVKGVISDIADPAQKELGYTKLPTSATASMLKGIATVKANLEAVRAPTILFVSRQDHVSKPANSELVFERVSSTDKELVWLERSYHVATLDHERDLIFERSAQFFRSHVKS